MLVVIVFLLITLFYIYRLQCCLTTLHIATVYNTYNIYFPQYGNTPLKAARNPDIATLLTTYGATLGDVDNVRVLNCSAESIVNNFYLV